MSEPTRLRSTVDQNSPGARRRARLLTVGASLVAALLIWVIAVPVAGVDLKAPSGGPGSTEVEVVPVFSVIAMSLLAPLAGWALLAVLERFSGRARVIWTVIAAVVLFVSFGGPLFGAGLNAGSRVTLGLMHACVGLITIIGLARSSPR